MNSIDVKNYACPETKVILLPQLIKRKEKYCFHLNNDSLFISGKQFKNLLALSMLPI